VSDPVEALLFDMLEWIEKEERSYPDVMEAWRTSCPRLPVWEEANDRGFVVRGCKNGTAIVGVTAAGREFLRKRSVPGTSVKIKAM
jgi:D-3-phosphoglycerate dehydrogenase